MRALVAAAACCFWLAACSETPAGGAKSAADAFGTLAFDAKVGDGGLSDAKLPDAESDAASDVAQAEDDASAAAPDVAEVKKGFNYECKPLSVEACVTACGSAGQRKCLKEWGPCIPPPEFCGNCADDDCNGLINDGCPANPNCVVPKGDCPVAIIQVKEGAKVGTGTSLHLSAAGSFAQGAAKIAKWAWTVQGPAGAQGGFAPSAAVAEPTFAVDAAGQYAFTLQVTDDKSVVSCVAAVFTVTAEPFPAQPSGVGCADGTREGFVDQAAYPQIAGCAGAWDQPGITPDTVKPTCANQGGNSGPKANGIGCSSADLCAAGWHVCKAWPEVAQKSPNGCAGAVPADAKPKSLFFAIRQPSETGSKCGNWGDGFNDVFGCGNLGTELSPDKACGPLDRVLASTKPNACGFNEAEPNLGPWQCLGSGKSDLSEGANVTKSACQNNSCSYDGAPLGPSDKGGVLCCAGN